MCLKNKVQNSYLFASNNNYNSVWQQLGSVLQSCRSVGSTFVNASFAIKTSKYQQQQWQQQQQSSTTTAVTPVPCQQEACWHCQQLHCLQMCALTACCPAHESGSPRCLRHLFSCPAPLCLLTTAV